MAKRYNNKKNYRKNNGSAVKTVTQPKKVHTKVNYRKMASNLRKQTNMYGTISKLNKVGEVFPEQLRTKLRCVQYISVLTNTTAPIANDFLFKANGLSFLGAQRYQPPGTVASSFSPQYPSALATLLGPYLPDGLGLSIYSTYLVIGSSIKIELLSAGASGGTSSVVFSLFPTRDASTMTSSHVDEQPYVKSLLLPAVITTRAPYLYNSLSTKEFLGTGDITSADFHYTGGYNNVAAPTTISLPQNQWFWNLRIANTSASSTTPIQAELKVTQYFDVIFSKRNHLTTIGPG